MTSNPLGKVVGCRFFFSTGPCELFPEGTAVFMDEHTQLQHPNAQKIQKAYMIFLANTNIV